MSSTAFLDIFLLISCEAFRQPMNGLLTRKIQRHKAEKAIKNSHQAMISDKISIKDAFEGKELRHLQTSVLS